MHPIGEVGHASKARQAVLDKKSAMLYLKRRSFVCALITKQINRESLIMIEIVYVPANMRANFDNMAFGI